MVLPNFIVIGAQRSGTTFLDKVLRAHDEVYLPPYRKEIHYFDWHFARGADWYRGFFPSSGEASKYRAIGEVTPDYVFEPAVPARIAEMLPDSRLVMMLRNPVRRVFSGYLHHVRSFNDRRGFERFIAEQHDAVERGFYAQQIKRYLNLFSAHNIHIMISEEVFGRPQSELDRLAEFLNLTHSWNDASELVRDRVYRGEVPRFQSAFYYARRFGELLSSLGLDRFVDQAKRMGVPNLFGQRREVLEMPASIQESLQQLYEPHICELEALLGRPLDGWRAAR
jgi:hypothetical protein